jgi:hypothetical protein
VLLLHVVERTYAKHYVSGESLESVFCTAHSL